MSYDTCSDLAPFKLLPRERAQAVKYKSLKIRVVNSRNFIAIDRAIMIQSVFIRPVREYGRCGFSGEECQAPCKEISRKFVEIFVYF